MNQIRLHVWGDYACFTRPEMKVERVSYDVITPSVARGILATVHWKPAIRWVIDRIYVLKPIRFESVRRNELGGKISAGKVSGAMKPLPSISRCSNAVRKRDNAFSSLVWGGREFPADFALIDEGEPLPPSALLESEANRDLGWMLHDIDFDHGNTPHFFRAQMKDGVIDVPPFYAEEVKV